MPRAGFHCESNPFLWRKIGDCEVCKDRCMDITTLRLIWKTEFVDAADHYHNDPKVVSVTETMGCLRRAYYDRTESYTELPSSLKARVWGTIIHAAREAANDDGNSEVELRVDLGGGYTLRGTADRLTDDAVLDYKTMDNPRKTYDDANATQLSIYSEMAELEYPAAPDVRRLLVLQDGRRGEAVHEVHRVEDALYDAKGRANLLIDAIDKGAVDSLGQEGLEMMVKFTGKSVCQWCCHTSICGVDLDD